MISVIYREENDRWIRGDRHVRPLLRRLIRGAPERQSGMQKVVANFLHGLNLLGVDYEFNRSLLRARTSTKIISFGLGMPGLEGVDMNVPVIAAVGYPYPQELPELCEHHNIRKFLQHSNWVLNLAKSANIYRDDIFDLWNAGIDTDEWRPFANAAARDTDVLIYNKIHWDKEQTNANLVQPIRDFLTSEKRSFAEINYGTYSAEEYKSKLNRAKAMVFLSAHESQGIAYQECLASGVPVLAWDQGFWLDPIRFAYGRPIVQATSVPFFDDRCGDTFIDAGEFRRKFGGFFDRARRGEFSPRDYVLENLSIEDSTHRMMGFYNAI